MDKRFPKEIPINAYRLQMGPEMTLKKVVDLLPYLSTLGIDTIYASPFFECVPGLGNAYAITSNIRLDPQVGTLEEFWDFSKAIEEAGFKLIIDFVPNHMAASEHHPWFRDVLRNGLDSKYARYFDIFWDNHLKGLSNKLLLPILAKPLEQEIESGNVKVEGKMLKVYGREIPLAHNTKGESVEEVLQSQHYILCEWKESCHRTNYRRFFDIHDLIGINMEIPEVFESMHKLVFEMAAFGAITGIRIDHPDGLYDPGGYFRDIKLHAKGIYLIAEKILQSGENLNPDWEVDGTVGYGFLNQLTQLFVDQKNSGAFERLYCRFIDEERDVDEILYLSKKEIITKYLSGEIAIIASHLHKRVRLLITHYMGDYGSLKDVIIEFLAHMVVYRTYITPESVEFSSQDRAAIIHAFEEMERFNPKLCGESFELLKQLFLLEYPNPFRRIYLKLQQFMPCVFAKAFEDTFLYNYNRLLALNEVGGNPESFGMSAEQFHLESQMRLSYHPYSMITTTTHDTKRSHDVRMRLAALSEMPQEWEGYISTLRQIANPTIDANTEYFIYQTLIALWPLNRKEVPERLRAYMTKAMREAKRHTSWVEVDEKYEERVHSFCERILKNALFCETLEPFAAHIAECGECASLSSLAIKLCSPGVIDLYQGTEVYNDSLVDPDNRRPVNFAHLAAHLKNHSSEKQTLLQKGLQLRLEEPELFLHGEYNPLRSKGEGSRHTVAFERKLGKKRLICIAGRFFSSLNKPVKAIFEGLDIQETMIDLFKCESLQIKSDVTISISKQTPFVILYKK